MKEASKTKFYLAKYLFLALALLQWLVVVLVLTQGNLKSKFAALIFFTTGSMFLVIQVLVAAKLKRVAMGKKKVTIIEQRNKRSYEWPEVKSMRLIPFFNLYSMKVKGRKKRIYFLPSQSTPAIFGMFSSSMLSEKTKS